MCDSYTLSVLESVVNDFVDHFVMFTAFDVTKAAVSKGVVAKHYELKNDIHKLASNTNYTRTAIDINGNEAFLYHPVGADISVYVKKVNSNPYAANTTTNSKPQASITQVPQTDPITSLVNTFLDVFKSFDKLAPAQAKVAASIPPKSPAKTNSITSSPPPSTVTIVNSNGTLKPYTAVKVSSDKRGRVWIPKVLIKSLGLAPKDKVKAKVEGGQVRVGKNVNSNTVYTVDKSGNVAVSQSLLQQAGLSSKPSLSVGVGVGDTVTIS